MNYLEKYSFLPNQAEIDSALALIAQNGHEADAQVLETCFSAMDLTTLKSDDTASSVAALVDKVNAFEKDYPQYPLPASICVYSNFASLVSSRRNNPALHTTVVSACFPTSQSFLQVKLLECRMAVEAGADEVDIVLALNAFLNGDYEAASEEIRSIRRCVDEAAPGRKVILKVIL